MMVTTHAPSRVDLVERAAGLVPVLRSHALRAEEQRRLPDEILAGLTDAGLTRMRVPHRYGGYASDTRTLVDVTTQLGRGDGSTAWNVAVWSIGAWLACMFPDQVQDEVFADPNVRVCGVLSPTAVAEPADGGLVVNGRWRFVSGALHSQWQMIVAMAPAPDGSQWPIMAAVPMSDLEIVDDWHTAGLCGTGSVSTVASQVFVPAERIMPMVAILQQQYASAANASTPIYRQPMIASASASVIGTALGMAKAATSTFHERLPDRKITYTAYTSQAEAPQTHLQVAEAAFKVDEAECHADRLTAMINEKCASGEPWTTLERVQTRALLGRVIQLGKEAIGVLRTASGGSSIYKDVPIQRIDRDVQTLQQHALMHPSTNSELYGRVLCGQEPNTLYF